MDFSRNDDNLQVAVSPEGEVVTLQDERFPWAERKVKTVKLAKLYEKAGYPDYSLRAATCSTWLQYLVSSDGSKQLSAANFCQLRLCPLCISRRAKRAVYKLNKVMEQVDKEHGAMFLFLTLTVKNVPGNQLGDTLSQMTKAWDRLMKHRHVKAAVKGWFRTIEVTRGDNRWHKDKKTGKMKFRRDEGYHPHIHAVLAVLPEYFSRKSDFYISHSEWVDRWQKVLGAEYRPRVRIQTSKAKGEYEAGKAAAVEAAKYAVKDEDYIDETLPESRLIEVLKDYTEALYRRRLTAFGGWMKEAAKALNAENLDDGDLVHIEEDRVREDVAELIEVYGWHFGAGDYILTSRQVNPLKVQRKD